MILDNHCMDHQKKAGHLKATLHHETIHPIKYQTYYLTRIQIQVHQTLLCQIHLTHLTTIIIKEDDERKRIKINSGVKHVSMDLSKSAQSLQPSYLQPRKNQRLLSSNWMSIHYSGGFVSYNS